MPPYPEEAGGTGPFDVLVNAIVFPELEVETNTTRTMVRMQQKVCMLLARTMPVQQSLWNHLQNMRR